MSSSTAIGTVCGLVLGDGGDRVGEQSGAEVGVDPGPGDDAGAEGRARVVTRRRLGGGDGRVDVVGIDMAVVVEVPFEDLGALAPGSARSRFLQVALAEVGGDRVVGGRAEQFGTGECNGVHQFGFAVGPGGRRLTRVGPGTRNASTRPTCRRR